MKKLKFDSISLPPVVSVESSHVPLAVASGCWTFVGICYYQEVEGKKREKEKIFLNEISP
jgi:hypothetical protein